MWSRHAWREAEDGLIPGYYFCFLKAGDSNQLFRSCSSHVYGLLEECYLTPIGSRLGIRIISVIDSLPSRNRFIFIWMCKHRTCPGWKKAMLKIDPSPPPLFLSYIKTNKGANTTAVLQQGSVTLQTESEVSLIIVTEDGGIWWVVCSFLAYSHFHLCGHLTMSLLQLLLKLFACFTLFFHVSKMVSPYS